MIRSSTKPLWPLAYVLTAAGAVHAQLPKLTPDITGHYAAPTTADDYIKRDVMIPMRDGVRLHTVIVVPKGARNAPMILTRTPYNASQRAERNDSPHSIAVLPQGDEVFVADGYIRVFQDVRGKYGSEGDYAMTRPLRGPLNDTEVDHSTDAYDTIDWLMKHVPESNGRVGMLGSSCEGFTVVMALVHPHPALKVAAPMSPMVDGYLFHFNLTGNRQKIAVDDPRVEDRVADNTAKFDVTESESVLIGQNFGIGTDIQTGPNGNLYVVSLDRGVVYELFRKSPR